MEDKCEHEGKWISPYGTSLFQCIKCHQFYATIRTHGTKLNNRLGITSVITGWWTFSEVLKRSNKAHEEGGFIRTVHHEPEE